MQIVKKNTDLIPSVKNKTGELTNRRENNNALPCGSDAFFPASCTVKLAKPIPKL